MTQSRNIGRPLKQDSSLSKERILSLALKMIDEGGEKTVSFRALAKKLAVTPMAVSHHVGSRQQMFASLVGHVFDGVCSGPQSMKPADKLRFILVRYCDRVLKHPNLIKCVLADPSLFDSELISLTGLIRSEIKKITGGDRDDALLNLIIDYTHGFAFSTSVAPSSGQLTTDDYLRSLDWILKHVEG